MSSILGMIVGQILKVTCIVNPEIRLPMIELYHDFLPLSTSYVWDVTEEDLKLLGDYDVR